MALLVDGTTLTDRDVARFLSKLMPEPNSGCWLWTDALTGDGYGNLGVGGRGGKKLYAHRISYTLFKGAIPERHEPDHLCRNRACENPAHLDAVPRRVNLLHGYTNTARNASKAVCLRGHPLPPYEAGKKRQCKPCANAGRQLSRARRRSA